MKNLTQYQRDALLVLRTRLNPRDPHNTASPEVKIHLEAIRNWIDSWIIPALDTIDCESEFDRIWLREQTSEEARRFRVAAGRGAHSPDPLPYPRRVSK